MTRLIRGEHRPTRAVIAQQQWSDNMANDNTARDIDRAAAAVTGTRPVIGKNRKVAI
jgi:hypothetical protein